MFELTVIGNSFRFHVERVNVNSFFHRIMGLFRQGSDASPPLLGDCHRASPRRGSLGRSDHVLRGRGIGRWRRAISKLSDFRKVGR